MDSCLWLHLCCCMSGMVSYVRLPLDVRKYPCNLGVSGRESVDGSIWHGDGVMFGRCVAYHATTTEHREVDREAIGLEQSGR